MKMKKLMSLVLATAMVLPMAACGSGGEASDGGETAENVPTFDQLNPEDYPDLKADIKILTDRTDIVDTVYKGYADEFHEKYPNITVTYEGVTGYAEAVTMRLTAGDWGDICFIPATVEKSEFSTYFVPLGDFDVLDEKYNYLVEKTYDGTVYGIPNGGTAGGVAYNKKVWEKAGIKELPKTPDEFLADLQLIKDKTDVAAPLYTNFSAGWTMGAWNDYVGIASTGDPDYKNNVLLHTKNPFTKNSEMSGPYAVYYTLYEAVSRGLVEEDPASGDWEASKGMINNGEIGAMVLGSWCVGQFMAAGDHPEDIGYMPFPISVNGKQAVATGGNYAYAINKESSADNQIAAMIYMKWLLEESSIFKDEGSIPALKSEPLPDSLSGLTEAGVEFLTDNAPQEGEENLYDDIRNTEDVLSGDYPVCNVVEAAMYKSSTLDELMDDWNQKWTSAQESFGVEVNE